MQHFHMSRDARKPVFEVSKQDLRGRGIDCTVRVAKTKGADQLRSYSEADLRFRLGKNPVSIL